MYTLLIGILATVIIGWLSEASIFFTGGLISDEAVIAYTRLFGLLAAFLLPLQLILIGRVKWVESVFGLDKLSRLHRINGLVILGLIIAHPFLELYMNAKFNETGFVAQYLLFLGGGGDILFATLGFLILLGTIIWSLTIIRKKLKYEWWYWVHVFNYLAIALIFLHIHEMTENSQYWIWPVFWFGLYTFTAFNVLWFRFTRPVIKFHKHKFVISKVDDLGQATSIYISGQKMDKFKITAGQFMIFRFLQPGFWTQAHPFSMSMAPNGREIRLTAKKLGDFTNELPKLKVGTKVLIDGPHGVFTEKLITHDKLLFIAGGIGITPIRSMLEALGSRYQDKVLLYSNKTVAETVLGEEITSLSEQNNFSVINIYSNETVSGSENGFLDKAMLARLVPDLSDRDIFLCGPPPMMIALRKAMIELGVPKSQIHFERFAL